MKADEAAGQDLGDLGQAFVGAHLPWIEAVGAGEAYGHGTGAVGEVILAAGRYCRSRKTEAESMAYRVTAQTKEIQRTCSQRRD